jgi:LemA protein
LSTTALVVIALAAVLGLWILGAYNRLVRHRNAVVQAFTKLHEQLARRHVMTQDLIARATLVAAGDSTVRLQSIVATLEAARTAVDYAKAAPLDAERVNVVDRAEVALSHRLARFIATLGLSPACRDDDELRRLKRELANAAGPLEFAAQAFNRDVLDYNRAAREAPTHLVARTFGVAQAAVVSPHIGKLPLKRKKQQTRGAQDAAVAAEPAAAAGSPGATAATAEAPTAEPASADAAQAAPAATRPDEAGPDGDASTSPHASNAHEA